ncbi:General transcription factor IIE subunit 1 [Chionoecetes opilio]|uniref:General transcription factor IIE subunit 1 n=1 Tax=Chionoecetes opilio TaxID=41210 RepID=A0A8J4YPZ6_CHIOP|nr:General transcription factor IIE subunit 1 [Chionoecetes opilio]
MDGEVLTEVPQKLQMLVRLVVRGFYTIEDILIIDMLVRNFCMSEDDLCDLLKFDRKMLRQRISTLRADRFIQARSKMVTVEDSKTQKEQYYFINYKSFVNVVKYKLDHMRKKLEMEERDQTSRASFVCHYCQRSYTDLEADQLLDIQTGQLQCIICKQEVQEDMSGMPRHDTRLLLTKFNEQMEPLFNLLREVENIKLAAKFSEPQPKDFSNLKKPGENKGKGLDNSRAWSGDSTKKSGFQVEGSIDVNINAEGAGTETVKVKEKPIWLSDATSLITTKITSGTASPKPDFKATPSSSIPQQGSGGGGGSGADDVMVLLQTHERHAKKGRSRRASDSDSDDSDEVTKRKNTVSQPSAAARRYLAEPKSIPEDDVIELGDTDDEEEEDTVPQVSVAGEQVAITEVDNALIARMTQEEKNAYMLMYQDYMCSPDD